MDEVRKEQQAVDGKIKRHEEDLKAIDKEINSLQEELNTATERKDKAYASVLELRKQRDEGVGIFLSLRFLRISFLDNSCMCLTVRSSCACKFYPAA